jgi:hypothetical protein
VKWLGQLGALSPLHFACFARIKEARRREGRSRCGRAEKTPNHTELLSGSLPMGLRRCRRDTFKFQTN